MRTTVQKSPEEELREIDSKLARICLQLQSPRTKVCRLTLLNDRQHRLNLEAAKLAKQLRFVN
ncbi:MAG: hypothetical protein A2751_03805 [Candidatus Doudnabacteria bacterium RIFCSPHIGHO2_01_FULL_46_14]|uniref:Uncharacterized protein n=1 Tax=Candidatus Doudnabacteria bacterium RIFCSPHIGHO2_01_FULL_46_14 TaxID=1817824 RepID=A0A1F5NLI0_9BACT|nr:MAG: hypothetical protein A2751_03805 [Candidatus Doudnabacteria bacterium RIFCSPHIGHO2_01_FULL_46_14]